MLNCAFELIKEHTINDLVHYRAHEDGHLYVNEWYREQYHDGNCDYYYYGEHGVAVFGLFEVAMPEEADAQLRCFEYDGKMMTNVFYTITSAEGNVTYSIDSNGVATEIPSSDPEYNEGWNEIDGSYKYVVDGEPVKDQVIWIEDEQTGEEKLYGFNGDGWMYSNTQFYLYDEWTGKEVYYCAHEDGHLYVNEWYDNPYNGFEYYYTEDGKAPTGLIELRERNGTEVVLYCFDQDGSLKRGGEYIDDDGYFYEISDGIAAWAEERTGWYHDRYYNSYYIQNGRTVRNTVIYVEDEQRKYNWFGFRDDGMMYSNCPFSIEDEEGSISYYRASRVLGRLFVNQWYEDEDNSEWYYYFDGGKAREGLQTIDGVMYVFAYDGRMLTDTTYTDENGVEYTVDSNGVATRVSSPEDNGYWDENGERYYIDGSPVCSAVIMIDGAYYGFNNSGYLYRDCYFDIWSENGYSFDSYYALEDGHLLVNDWWDQEDWGRTHYFGSDGREVSGFVEIDGTLYYFDRYTGLVRGGAFYDDNGDLYIVDKNGVATLVETENGWVETEDGNKYYLINGEAVKNQVIEIDGDYYGFDYDGVMYLDRVFDIYRYGEGQKYYCAGEDGKLIVSAWYEDYLGEKYYFGDDGEAMLGLQEIDGILYCFDDFNGRLQTERFVEDEQGNYYYADGNGVGTLIEGNDGWHELPDGNWSYFIDGYPVENEALKIGGKYYAFNRYGIMFTEGPFVIYYGELYFHFYRAKADGSLYVNEWYEDKDNSEWYYYFDKGEAKEGPQNVGGTTYIFTYEGKMMTSCTYTDAKTGDKYEVDSSGVARIANAGKDGWNLIDGKYYYRENGAFIKHQVRKIGGSYYGFDYNGRMYDNQGFWIDAFYRAKKGGSLYVNEWYQEDGTNIWYYFGSDAKGADGWKQIGNKWYYFEFGEMMTGLQWINGSTYFFDDNGAMVTGWQEDAGKWYYYDPSGAMATDWKKIGSAWYYFDEEGEMATGLQEIGGTSYFFKDSGAMVTGWQQIEGSWYYFGSSGAMVKKNWQQSGNAWYYFDEEGEMATGLQEIGGTSYFFKDSGAMATGWQQIDGDWYFFNAGGAMVKENWQQSGNTWYYFDGEGKMLTGLQEIGGKIYFFKDSGAMVTGWQQVGDDWYYFESGGAAACSKWVGNYYMLNSGVMATNQWVDNGKYYVGADGLWIPDYKEAI